LWSPMPRGKCRAVCIVLAAGLWVAWPTAIAASLLLSFYAMSLVGLGKATAALAAVVGALAAVVLYVYGSDRGRFFYAYVRRSGKCQLDGGLSAELGVEVYKCEGWYSPGSSALLPKPYITVDQLEFSSEEEQRAVVYHELSHIRRRDSFVKEALKGAAKASAVVVVFQLALAAGLGAYAYIAAAAAASLIWREEAAETLGDEELSPEGLFLSFIFLSLPAGLLARLLPPGPAPQIGPLDALTSSLAAAGAYMASKFASHVSELLADVESALAVGPGPLLQLFTRAVEEEREAWGELKRRLVEGGAKYPTLRYLFHRLLDTHPPAAVRMRLIRLCRT